jgi:murein DD-endopeptidase MepM/ murein hydrolase activator NlpD
MTLYSHPGDRRRARRLWLAASGLTVLAMAALFAVASRSTGAAPVDGNREFLRPVALRESPDAAAGTAARPTLDGAADLVAALPDAWSQVPRMRLRYSRALATLERAEAGLEGHQPSPSSASAPAPVLNEHRFTVRPGDSLSTLFESEGLARGDLAAIMAAGSATSMLARLRPGDRINVYTDVENRVQGLTLERPRGKRLEVARDGDTFRTGVAARPAGAVLIDRPSDNSNDWVELHKPLPALVRRSVEVRRGDSLYSIFKRNGFALGELDAIVKASDDTRELRRLVPGQRLEFHLTRDSSVSRLVHYFDETRTLQVRRNGVGYDSKVVDVPLDRHVATAAGTIEASLFLAARRQGLSNNVIMQLVEIFGWDVDFALDIRAGDRFAVVYEELYKHGKKLRDGAILAASFTNQGKTTRIVRYEYPDGRTAYFTPEGVSIRKAFLRSPVIFARISSGFSLRRKHPVLHKFRAHRGVDYAAPRGTPIKATGDGKIEYIGYKGGYGKTIVLRHGATYTTLYAHMSRFARKLRRGQRVNQGQIIGYIGSTGLSSGPHLHYEFRVRGVHRNPLRVKLPKASPIEEKYEQHFLATTGDLVAHLGIISNPTLAADERRLTDTD